VRKRFVIENVDILLDNIGRPYFWAASIPRGVAIDANSSDHE
jgi:hypothetical protein